MRIKYLLTTRFNNDTWFQNEQYRNQNTSINCVYGSPQSMAPKIYPRITVFVAEMNNDTNQVLGIGLIKNEPHPRYEHMPYTNGNFNRFVFTGRYRLDRSEIDPAVLDILDYILFKEKTHMKRGAGFTTVPEKLLYHRKCEGLDILNELNKGFVNKYKLANNEIT